MSGFQQVSRSFYLAHLSLPFKVPHASEVSTIDAIIKAIQGNSFWNADCWSVYFYVFAACISTALHVCTFLSSRDGYCLADPSYGSATSQGTWCSKWNKARFTLTQTEERLVCSGKRIITGWVWSFRNGLIPGLLSCPQSLAPPLCPFPSCLPLCTQECAHRRKL